MRSGSPHGAPGAVAPSLAQAIEPEIPALRRFAWTLARNAAEADDLVQDCLERAISRWAQRRGGDPVRPWLMAIMHRIHIDRWRRWRRRGGDHLPLEEWDAPAVEDAEARIGYLDVMAAMARLPEEQRSVLMLVGVEGLSYDEAAVILAVPVGTVMSRLSRGRERLRRHIEGESDSPLRRVK